MGCSASIAMPPSGERTPVDLLTKSAAGAGDLRSPLDSAENRRSLETRGSDRSVRALYEFSSVLGRGGYSVVRLAVHRKTGQEFAVKIITMTCGSAKRDSLEAGSRRMQSGDGTEVDAKEDDSCAKKQTPSLLNSVLNEIEILRALDHPSLMKLHEHFIEGSLSGKAYLVLEMLTGGDLASLLDTRGKLTPPEARQVFYRVLTGIEYIHRKGFVHRDLKLENVMLARPGDLGSATIADFGLACRVKDNASGMDPSALVTVCGTPTYMSPECIRAVKRGARKGQPSKWFATKAQDMWSAGIVLHALLTGFFPYETTDVNDNLFSHILHLSAHSLAGPHWDGVPPAARQLVVDLLNPFEDHRPTAARGLRSAWLTQVARGSAEDVERLDTLRRDTFVDSDALSIHLSAADQGERQLTDSARESESGFVSNGKGGFWESKGSLHSTACPPAARGGKRLSEPVGAEGSARQRAVPPSASAASVSERQGAGSAESQEEAPRHPAPAPVGDWWQPNAVGGKCAPPMPQLVIGPGNCQAPDQHKAGVANALSEWLAQQGTQTARTTFGGAPSAAESAASNAGTAACGGPGSPTDGRRLDEIWGVRSEVPQGPLTPERASSDASGVLRPSPGLRELWGLTPPPPGAVLGANRGRPEAAPRNPPAAGLSLLLGRGGGAGGDETAGDSLFSPALPPSAYTQPGMRASLGMDLPQLSAAELPKLAASKRVSTLGEAASSPVTPGEGWASPAAKTGSGFPDDATQRLVEMWGGPADKTGDYESPPVVFVSPMPRPPTQAKRVSTLGESDAASARAKAAAAARSAGALPPHPEEEPALDEAVAPDDAAAEGMRSTC